MSKLFLEDYDNGSYRLDGYGSYDPETSVVRLEVIGRVKNGGVEVTFYNEVDATAVDTEEEAVNWMESRFNHHKVVYQKRVAGYTPY